MILAVYARTLEADFLHWDDPEHVYENPRVTERDGIVRSWTETKSPGFYPITYTTFYLEWRAGGGAPWVFHLDNVLLHAAGALLAAHLAWQVGLAPAAAWFTAAVWALHPMQVASVAWIAERKNVLYVVLYLASLSLFLVAEDRARSRLRFRLVYTLSLALFFLALLSKAAAATLPAGLALVQWARHAPLDRGFWLRLAPYAAVALGGGLALLASVPAGLQVPSLASRLTLPPRTLAFYLAKFLWPHPLLPMYPRWALDPPGPLDHARWLGLGALAAAGFVLRHRIPRPVLLGIGFFLVNVSLVAGLAWFTYLDHSPVADHLAYLPTLGLALAAVASLDAVRRTARLPPSVAVVALAGWCAALAVATWRQVPVWRDTERLWRYAIAHNPDCATCHYNLGVLLEDRQDLDAAAAHYEAALRVRPDGEAAINLGNVRLAQGRPEDARALYRRATELEPGNEKAHYNLGLVLAGLGSTDEAIVHYRAALRLATGLADAHRGLGDALLRQGRFDEATAEFEAALRLAPADGDAARGLARTAAARENWAAAVAHYERALRHTDGVGAARTHRELAEALQQLDRDDEAITHYRTAARLDPDDADAVTDLAAALLGRARVGEAVAALEEGVSRMPDHAPLASALAWIRATSREARWRDAEEAVRLAEHACALTGHEDPDPLDTLAAAYAEAGRLADAVRVGRRALEAAEPGSEQAEEIRARIALYDSGKAYRSPW